MSTDKNGPGDYLTFLGTACLGRHVLLELAGCDPLKLASDPVIKETMLKAVAVTGATLLHYHVHPFAGGGVTAVAVLAESHISIHTWPEYGVALVDAFMCGSCDPRKAAYVIAQDLEATDVSLRTVLRGAKAED